MIRIARIRWLIALCALSVSLTLLPGTASAQWYPNYGGYYPYGPYGYGGWGNFGWDTTRRIHQEDRMSAQARAAQQEAMLQASTRSALENDAWMRSQMNLENRRATRDWWTGVQDRQLMQRGPEAIQTAGLAMPQQPPGLYEAGGSLIAWPRALRLPAFSPERLRIEAPFARFASGGPPVDLMEYQTILALSANMRERLAGMSSYLSVPEFLRSQQFLDQLDAETEDRMTPATKACNCTQVKQEGQ